MLRGGARKKKAAHWRGRGRGGYARGMRVWLVIAVVAACLVACGGRVSEQPTGVEGGGDAGLTIDVCGEPSVIVAPGTGPTLTYCLPSEMGDPDPASATWCTQHGGTCRVEDERRVTLSDGGIATIGAEGCYPLRVCRL